MRRVTVGLVMALGAAGCAAGSTDAVPVKADAGRAASCRWFPADSFYHADVRRLPRHARSGAYVRSIGAAGALKADFGSGTWQGRPIGIPITKVPKGTPKVEIAFTWPAESDKGPYPIPRNARVEGGRKSTGDRHVIAVDSNACRLYELYNARPRPDGTWKADSGVDFDLRSNRLRPAGWTSADAAGLSIGAPLVKYDEVERGRIDHVLRITVPRVRNAYVWPARHKVGTATAKTLPPMGTWLRLKPGVKISGYLREARVILQALKTHGAIIADLGSAWYISGTQDSRWNNDALRALGRVKGGDFEAVDPASLIVARDSAQVR